VLALSTGARRKEIMTLTWKDIDLSRGIVIFQDIKNGERRAVPLTGPVRELLTDRADTRRTYSPFVFPNRAGTQPQDIRRAWELAVERAGIEDFRFHDLRHSAASYLAMNGASLVEIAEILGHKTLAMVKRYAHLSESHTRGVVERMNRTIFGE
jgi:integrase